VRPDGIHVTLKFIGEVPSDLQTRIESSLSEVHSDAPVEITFCGTGFFPDARRPRVFWAGIEASSNLSDIAAQIESRLEPLGIARETREFKPHLTLARISESRGVEKLHDALRRIGTVNFGTVQASEMHLYQSELGRGGAKYACLQTFNFSR
jgi:2'-5' RNA ligase